MNRAVGYPLIESSRLVRLRIWVIAILFFAVGDLATTGIGLGIDGVSEAIPLTAFLIQQYGLGAFVVVKLVVLGGCYSLWKYTLHPHRIGIPLGLAAVGILATGWNLHVLVLALLS